MGTAPAVELTELGERKLDRLPIARELEGLAEGVPALLAHARVRMGVHLADLEAHEALRRALDLEAHARVFRRGVEASAEEVTAEARAPLILGVRFAGKMRRFLRARDAAVGNTKFGT